jgi:hypothetical protein
MTNRAPKVTQETWQKSYEVSGQAHISTVTITPIHPTWGGDRLLVTSLLIDGKRDKFGTEHYIEPAAKVAERRNGLASTGYRLIDSRQVKLRAA